MIRKPSIALSVLFALLLNVSGVVAQGGGPSSPTSSQAAIGTAFTYQGQLKNGSGFVTGPCDFRFGLWDAPALGTQSGVTQTLPSVGVTSGMFTVALNGSSEFGAGAFTGSARYLQIAVKCAGDSAFTAFSSRQVLTPAPYALYASSAGTAGSATTANTANTALNVPWSGLTGAPTAWLLTGNGGTTASNFIGTTNNMTLTLAVGNTAALRLVPNSISPSIIAGYSGNDISATVVGGVIGGGGQSLATNRVTDYYGVVGGGLNNRAGNEDDITYNAYAATVGGGSSNTASSPYATVGGGENNTAGDHATVGGGANNNATGGTAVVAGGGSNTASGSWATVPGGEFNQASGIASFAAGDRANAVTNGAFVWADHADVPISSTVPNQFLVRASGGITLYTNSGATSGAALYSGSGSWNNLSDRNLKANFRPVDPLSILNQVAAVPVQTWNYTTQNESIRHIGPMAQDFSAAFNVGENNTTISTVDAQGVAFAAIQGLYQVAQAKDAQIDQQQTQISALQSQMDEQAQQLKKLKEQVAGQAPLPNANSQNILWFIAGGMMSLMAFGLGRRAKGGAR